VRIRVKNLRPERVKDVDERFAASGKEPGKGVLVLRGNLNEEDLPKVVEGLIKAGAKVLSVERAEPALEGVFIKLTGRAPRG